MPNNKREKISMVNGLSVQLKQNPIGRFKQLGKNAGIHYLLQNQLFACTIPQILYINCILGGIILNIDFIPEGIFSNFIAKSKLIFCYNILPIHFHFFKFKESKMK